MIWDGSVRRSGEDGLDLGCLSVSRNMPGHGRQLAGATISPIRTKSHAPCSSNLEAPTSVSPSVASGCKHDRQPVRELDGINLVTCELSVTTRGGRGTWPHDVTQGGQLSSSGIGQRNQGPKGVNMASLVGQGQGLAILDGNATCTLFFSP